MFVLTENHRHTLSHRITSHHVLCNVMKCNVMHSLKHTTCIQYRGHGYITARGPWLASGRVRAMEEKHQLGGLRQDSAYHQSAMADWREGF
jgi:hypothetical protein